MNRDKDPVPQWGGFVPGELLERWPRDESGEPEPPVYLCHCRGVDMEEALTVARMESYGIPCLRQYPDNGVVGRLILGVSGTGTDIFVPASLWADACQLLREPGNEKEDHIDELA